MRFSAGITALTLATLLGCASTGKLANEPAPEPMPPNSEWEGVYQGPYHIVLRIETNGSQATGTWSAIGGRDGELTGTVSGNLLVFDWTERATGNSEAWSGRGFLVYRADPGKPAEISGEASLGRGNSSTSWWAIKRPSVPLKAAASLIEGGEEGTGKCAGADCDPDDDDRDHEIEMDTED